MRKLNEMCTQENISEVHILKSTTNIAFIKKLIKEIKKRKNWSGPRIIIISSVQKNR